MSQGKGDKRRPCCIPSWLEDLRWGVAQGTIGREQRKQILRTHWLYDKVETSKYLMPEESELIVNV